MPTDTNTVPYSSHAVLPEGDYISPDLKLILPDFAFGHIIKGNVSDSTWSYLRREIPHNWYVDSRNPAVGFISRDEAAILHNTARLFQGRSCLEIGCWRGWSTVHLALGSGALDVIDPVLADPDFASDVKAACARAGALDSIAFHAGPSPSIVDDLARTAAKRWSLIFIDGDHEGDAPLRDAEAVERNAADDALVLFHDLVSPHVAAGLDYFRRQGWNTRIYQTMQIMGVAWRGEVEPVAHEPDARVSWTLPAHLAGYEVFGSPASSRSDFAGIGHSPARPGAGQRELELQHERDAALDQAAALQRDFAALAQRLPDLLDTIHESTLLNDKLSLAEERLRQAEQALVERDGALVRADDAERELASLLARLPDFAAVAHESDMFRGQLDAAHYRVQQLEQALAGAANRDALLQDAEDRVQRLTDECGAAQLRALAAEASLSQLASRIPAISKSLSEARAAEAACGELRAALVDAEALAAWVVDAQRRRHAAIRAQAEWMNGTRVLLGLLRRPGHRRVSIVRQQAELFGLPGLITPVVGHWLCRRRALVGLLRRSRLSRISIVVTMLLDADRSWSAEALAQLAREQKGSSTRADAPPTLRSTLDPVTRDSQALQRRFNELEQAKIADEAALLDARIELATLRAASRRGTVIQEATHG